MLDFLEALPAGARVLDLGARSGSFSTARTDILVVRLDLEIPAVRKEGAQVSGVAARMPFAPTAFDLAVSNHSLEHFTEMEATVSEIGRIVKPDGGLYVRGSRCHLGRGINCSRITFPMSMLALPPRSNDRQA